MKYKQVTLNIPHPEFRGWFRRLTLAGVGMTSLYGVVVGYNHLIAPPVEASNQQFEYINRIAAMQGPKPPVPAYVQVVLHKCVQTHPKKHHHKKQMKQNVHEAH